MRRELFNSLLSHLTRKEYTIVTGARQTGKSTLLRQLETHLNTINLPCIVLNLENKETLTQLNVSPLNVLNFLPVQDKKTIVLIDEIQYLNDPSNFLKLLHDEHSQTIKIVATGSSAFYIDDNFRDSLAGRKRVFQLLTCSFDEYLELTGKEDLLEERKRIVTNKAAVSTKINYLKTEWENYMLFGGYPAVITEPDRENKIIMLREIRDSFVKRDILESGVQNEIAFYNLFRLLAAQIGNLVNVNELSATLRIKSETINNYLFIMQKCFHLSLVKPFYKNLRKEITKMPKAFLLDSGLRNCLLNNFGEITTRTDKGQLWENIYFRILADRYGIDAIRFWRTSDGNEIDFVLPDIDKPRAYEIKSDTALIKPNKYKKFNEAYPEIPLYFGWFSPFNEDFFRRIML